MVIAFTAAYYSQSPLVLLDWHSKEVEEWYNAALKLEKEKADAFKEGMKNNGQES